MAEKPEDDDKTEDATQKKLDDAREKGDVIYSMEATTWLMLAVGALVLVSNAGPMAGAIGHMGEAMLGNAHLYNTDGDALMVLMGKLGVAIFAATGTVFLALAAAAIFSRYVQDRPAFSSERMKPQLSRLNPIEGFGRIFGPAGWGNLAKAVFKVVLVGVALTWAVWPQGGELEQIASMDIAAFWALAQEKLVHLVIISLIAFGAIAGVDYIMTRQAFTKRQRMTRTELRDEFRNADGDPQVKAKLRQIRMQRGAQRMMQRVPDATLVITNPTHYAIALKYDDTTPAPICLAKGVDDVALAIRSVAEEHSIPMIEDPPLARALFATVELEEPIPRQHYEAVAKVIGVVMRIAKRRRPARSRPNRV
ncbi:MAG: EscU/YscU/HrcU family type III secretion system export apparatus switch protein [Caulobacterales bacterium]